jgi:hypothetical protein
MWIELVRGDEIGMPRVCLATANFCQAKAEGPSGSFSAQLRLMHRTILRCRSALPCSRDTVKLHLDRLLASRTPDAQAQHGKRPCGIAEPGPRFAA